MRTQRPRRSLLVFDLAPTPFIPPSLPIHVPDRLPVIRPPSRRRQWNPVLQSILAGAIAEVVVIGLLYPLNTVKTVVQAGGKRTWKGLWNGLGATLPWAGLDAAAFTGVMLGVRAAMERCGLRTMGEWVSGGVAALASAVWFSPVEAIRDRMRVSGRSWRQVTQSIMNLGIGGFWKGAGGRLLSDLPFEIMEFGGFEWSLRKIEGIKGKVKREEVFVLGVLVGGLTGALVSPIEFAVTRVLCNGGEGVREVIGKTLREDGWKALFIATREAVLSESINSGLYFFVFDGLRKLGFSSSDHEPED